MKITKIECVKLDLPDGLKSTSSTEKCWFNSDEVANPMSRFPKVKAHRKLWLPKWDSLWCKVTLEDGSWGLGLTDVGNIAASIINDHLAPNLIGEDALAIERISDMMFRLTKPYGTQGLASYAISAIDLALWDAKGKILKLPVTKLIGGPKNNKLFCYATGNDVHWYKELGFKAFKLACPYGPSDGLAGIDKNEAFVENVRNVIGYENYLMLDCWMAFDVDYTVQLAERLKKYKLYWIEECLLSEDLEGHIELRNRLPWQTLTTGEHWYTHYPFMWAIKNNVVDILQPDINWVGGLTTCLKISAAADSAGKKVILHAGGRNPYGQHFSHASSSTPWLEYFVGADPGVPLSKTTLLPDQPVPVDGLIEPDDRHGFGLGIDEQWLVPW